MVTLDEFIKRLGRLPSFLEKKSSELLLKHEREVVALNNAQLMEGLNTEGKTMQKGYSKGYSSKRKKAGLQTSFVDLRFSGAYQDSRRGVKSDKGIDIESNTDYEKYLRGNFPKHVGLTKESSEKIAELLSGEVSVLTKKFLVG